MYQVTIHHHDKDIIRDDLEDKFELIDNQIFKTKHAAKNWILEKLKGKPKKNKFHAILILETLQVTIIISQE